MGDRDAGRRAIEGGARPPLAKRPILVLDNTDVGLTIGEHVVTVRAIRDERVDHVMALGVASPMALISTVRPGQSWGDQSVG